MPSCSARAAARSRDEPRRPIPARRCAAGLDVDGPDEAAADDGRADPEQAASRLARSSTARWYWPVNCKVRRSAVYDARGDGSASRTAQPRGPPRARPRRLASHRRRFEDSLGAFVLVSARSVRTLAFALRAGGAHWARPRRRGAAAQPTHRPRADRRGRGRAEHRRPSAAADHLPRGCRTHPRCRPRRDSIDVAVTDLEGRDSGPSRPTSRHRRRAGADPGSSRRPVHRPAISDPRSPGALWGVGIGIPGPVEFRTGRPISPPIMPGWDMRSASASASGTTRRSGSTTTSASLPR